MALVNVSFQSDLFFIGSEVFSQRLMVFRHERSLGRAAYSRAVYSVVTVQCHFPLASVLLTLQGLGETGPPAAVCASERGRPAPEGTTEPLRKHNGV